MPRALVLAVLFAATVTACASAGSSQLRGRYFWGNEVETFHPCGTEQSFWIVGDNSLLQPLRAKTTELSRAKGQPYQPIYIEASGTSEGKASDGFAADYDGVYRLTAVQVVSDAAPDGCKEHG
jgi:hypothetical protein